MTKSIHPHMGRMHPGLGGEQLIIKSVHPHLGSMHPGLGSEQLMGLFTCTGQDSDKIDGDLAEIGSSSSELGSSL